MSKVCTALTVNVCACCQKQRSRNTPQNGSPSLTAYPMSAGKKVTYRYWNGGQTLESLLVYKTKHPKERTKQKQGEHTNDVCNV